MRAGSNDYRAAERYLMDAIRAGEACDFADGADITAEEMGTWGPERTIRATLLRRILTAEDAEFAADGIRLRGAAVEGFLDLRDMNVMHLDLEQCRIATIEASGATFTGKALFTGATFTNVAWFTGATFTSAAWFEGATFTSAAWFEGATFTNVAWFDDATFTSDAQFTGATFTHDAVFTGATLTSDAWFTGATFTSAAIFGGAGFDGATFTSAARFNGATFTSEAEFTDVTFTSIAEFEGAIADAYDFRRAQFHTTDAGPWIARRVTLTGAVFHVRAQVAIASVERSDCTRLQAREGVHLVVRGDVILEGAELLRPSILAYYASAFPSRQSPGERPEGFDKLTPAEQVHWMAREKALQLAQKLAEQLGPQQAQVVSLRGATAGDLVLSGMGLDDCAFAGAHGLDRMRIGATCSFQRPPAWPRDTRRPFTRRRLIFEEAQWPQAHTRGWPTVSTTATATATAERDDPGPTALEIAGIYRDLRKGLEDAKDEPGAADFYYGEMEMRRLAARGHRHQDNDDGGAKGRLPSWTERRLLDAYWAVSGYGLRAWRALTALTILLVGCAALLTLPAFGHLPAPPPQVASVNLQTGAIQYTPTTQPSGKTGTTAAVPFGTSLEFTATESLTLIRASGTPLLQTTGTGTVLDIAVRLLAPLLLGLALLAVRGRTKR